MAYDGAAQRRWFAEDLRLQAPIRRNMAIVDAFAAVARERFCGPGPWRILTDRPRLLHRPDGYVTTPDDDPRWICHDVLVAIDPGRALNNGLPSFWARNFDHLDLKRGERILQVGAGAGYYTAILAEIAGPEGRVTAVEHDEALAAQARINLGPWPQVEAMHGDGRSHDPGEVDAVIVFAGSTHPAPLWLDRLAPGGRLLMPLTGNDRWGLLLLVIRRDPERFEARSIGGVGIFHCIGGRDEEAAKRLADALRKLPRGGGFSGLLHPGDPGPEATDGAWYQGPGFWLERQGDEGGASPP